MTARPPLSEVAVRIMVAFALGFVAGTAFFEFILSRFALNILDPKFKYVDAASTDLRKTFARIRREQREAKAAKQKPLAPVATIPRKTSAR